MAENRCAEGVFTNSCDHEINRCFLFVDSGVARCYHVLPDFFVIFDEIVHIFVIFEGNTLSFRFQVLVIFFGDAVYVDDDSGY